MCTGCRPAARAPATSYRRLSPTCRTVPSAGTPRASSARRKICRVGLGHADHRGVEDDAHRDPRGRGVRRRVRDMADAEAAQVALHAAVGVGDHAHRQAERGHGPQAVHRPEADVRPAVPPDPLGHLGGEQFGPVRGHAAGGGVAEQVVAPPGGLDGRQGLGVLGRHRLVVSPLQGGQVGVHAGRAQRRQHVGGLGKTSTPPASSKIALMPEATPALYAAAQRQSGGCLSFHGRACSSWADREIRVASSPIRPASITPIGRPSAFQCSGTFTAGWPDTL